MPKWNAKKVAEEVEDTINMSDDLIVHEVRGARSKAEALSRLAQIMQDVEDAIEIVQDS